MLVQALCKIALKKSWYSHFTQGTLGLVNGHKPCLKGWVSELNMLAIIASESFPTPPPCEPKQPADASQAEGQAPLLPLPSPASGQVRSDKAKSLSAFLCPGKLQIT